MVLIGITNFNTQQNNLKGETAITQEHIKNNQDVRELLGKPGIKPEDLPPEEDIQKLERRVKSQEKKMTKKIKEQTVGDITIEVAVSPDWESLPQSEKLQLFQKMLARMKECLEPAKMLV